MAPKQPSVASSGVERGTQGATSSTATAEGQATAVDVKTSSVLKPLFASTDSRATQLSSHAVDLSKRAAAAVAIATNKGSLAVKRASSTVSQIKSEDDALQAILVPLQNNLRETESGLQHLVTNYSTLDADDTALIDRLTATYEQKQSSHALRMGQLNTLHDGTFAVVKDLRDQERESARTAHAEAHVTAEGILSGVGTLDVALRSVAASVQPNPLVPPPHLESHKKSGSHRTAHHKKPASEQKEPST